MQSSTSRRVRTLTGHLRDAPGCSGANVTTAVDEFPALRSDVFALDELLTAEEAQLRQKIRMFAEREVAPIINQYWENADFPFQLLPKLGALGIGGCNQKGYGCSGHSLMSEGIIMMELARVDPSMSLCFLVHDSLCMYTIGTLGSEDQKRKYLSKLATFEHVGCWAMTEPEWGSDAASLATTATKVEGGWRLDGAKRWIGNSTFADVCVCFARNVHTDLVNAFILEPKSLPGWSARKMENKTGMRVVQNGDITLDGAVVPESSKLPGATDFAAATSALAASRLVVTWQPVGMAMGIYDLCLRYLCERTQFGAPLAALQINQEKLMRMLGTIQGMILMAWRVTRMAENNKATPGMASLTKATLTMRGREVASLGRELLGGNGILHDFHVAKVFNDMEAVHTYEGTYEVNMLIAAREMTGIAAFKSRIHRTTKDGHYKR